MSETRTEIASLGEFGLIEHLTKNFETHNASTILGVGDDAAVIDHFGKQTVITTDLLLEGIHFDLMYTPLKHLGYKAVMVNLSDIYAMNATPTQITVSIGISNRFSLEAVTEFYEGVHFDWWRYIFLYKRICYISHCYWGSGTRKICKKKYCLKRRFDLREW
jgi:thiamine-monophosphate kinase